MTSSEGHWSLSLEQLVDLLLVLCDREPGAGMVDDEQELLCHGILVHGHRQATERLRRAHRAVEPRTISADDREPVAPLEAERREPAGEPLDLVLELAPRPALPDAVLLLARRVPIRESASVEGEQLRKRIEGGRGVCARPGICCLGHRLLPSPGRAATCVVASQAAGAAREVRSRVRVASADRHRLIGEAVRGITPANDNAYGTPVKRMPRFGALPDEAHRYRW